MLAVVKAESTDRFGTSGWPDSSEPYSGVTSSILGPDIPVSFHANSVIVLKLRHDLFLAHLLQEIAFWSSCCDVYAVSHL